MSQELKINISSYRGCPILEVIGEVDMANIDRLNEVSTEIELAPLIIVDLTRVTYFESVGVKWLVDWRRKHGGIILFMAVSSAVKSVLQTTGLLPFFPIFDDSLAARKALDDLITIAGKEDQ